MQAAAKRIGFIGLGLMGHGMAKNLLAKGYSLTLLPHRNRQSADDLIGRGAKEAKSPAELATVSDIIFLCVPGSPQVELVVRGNDGLLGAARRGLIVVDCSTSEPDSTAAIRADFDLHGTAYIDAPLARTPKEAEEGRLNVMVGATPEEFAAIRPALGAFAENVFHVGGPGAGHKTKLINNFLAMGQAALIAEALAAGAKVGLDLQAFYQVVSAGGANSGIFQMIVPAALSGDYTGLKFGLSLAQKDLRYYTHMVESARLPSFLGEAVHQSFVQANSLGFGSGMVGSLIEAQQKIGDVTIAAANNAAVSAA